MRAYEVELNIHFHKTVHIQAPDDDAAAALAEAMLLCTDAMHLTDDDMVGLNTTVRDLETGRCVSDDNEEAGELLCPDCVGNVGCHCPLLPDEEDEDDDDDDESDEDDDFPITATSERMSLGELMLHLSCYLEDAEDELDDVRDTLAIIERYANAILQAKNDEAIAELKKQFLNC